MNNLNDNNLLILLYHGVYEHELNGIENYSGKHINKNDFVAQLQLLKNKNYNFLSFEEIVQIIKTGNKFPKKSVALSFDDGFYNNYKIACPILDDFKIPTIFYVCSGLIGKKNLFWVDIIEACINNCKQDILDLKLDKIHRFNVKDIKTKINTNEIIKKYCKRSKINIRDRVLKDLINITDIKPTPDMSVNYEIMNWKDLKEINNNDLFTVGGHNMFHDTFTNIEPENIYLEISNTIELIKKNLNSKVEHYSYPEGQASDYNSHVIDELKKQGIKCCPSAIYGFNSEISNLFHLKRIMPGFMNTKFPVT